MGRDKIDNFETVCLSLPTDVHRKQYMLDEFDKLKLPVWFFDACTPEDLTQEDREFYKLCDFFDWDINQEAAMATFKSHLKILNYSVKYNRNLLVIEDDIDYVKEIDFDSIDFSKFDLYNLGIICSCYSYFVSVEGAKKIIKELNSKKIYQAFDWELAKLETVNMIRAKEPHFIQHNKHISNIAPNGYKRK